MINFDLESLGWKNFEDLALTVATHQFGINARPFSLGQDDGIDGRGISLDDGAEQTIVQSKHTSVGSSLTATDFRQSELGKIRRLAKQGSCDRYLLITNRRLSARSDQAIRRDISQLGVTVVDVLGREAVRQLLAENKRLRGILPRMYGLGDLSEILDGRLYEQTLEVIRGADLAKFVSVPSYFETLSALQKHGIALILGEPASGKSSILSAASLALIDQFGMEPLWLGSIDDLQSHWNPNRSEQLFLLDDAFGATSFDSSRADAWNRQLPFLKAALNGGAKLIATSRNYVYADAKNVLKRGELPAALEESIVIDVAALSWDERNLLVYNHLRLGSQPKDFKSRIKVHLNEVTRTTASFLPETARRLGDPFFTKKLDPSNIDQIYRFMTEPSDYLDELIGSLNQDAQVALLVLLAMGGQVEVPVESSPLLDRLQCSEGEVGANLESMDGALVLRHKANSIDVWSARHPTVLDAIGRWLLSRPEWLDLFVEFAPLPSVMQHISVGLDVRGAVGISDRLRPMLWNRLLSAVDERPTVLRFLRRRVHPDSLTEMATLQELSDLLTNHRFASPLDGDPGANLLLHLAQNQLLEADTIQSSAESIVDVAVDEFDHWAVRHPAFQELLLQLDSGPSIATDLIHRHARAINTTFTDFVEMRIRTYSGDVDRADEFAGALDLVSALEELEISLSETVEADRLRISRWVGVVDPSIKDPDAAIDLLRAVFGSPRKKDDIFADLDE